MTKEYYTPTIEEFHIGFEFEKYDNRPATYKENDFKPTNWHKHTYNLTSIRLSQLGTHLYNKTLRVKYLDKLDIESLGFIGQEANSVYFKKDNIRLVHWLNDPVRVTSIYKIYSAIEEEKIFDGTIKNISELKVLLKQLNIHD
jgi:hypothetical protein